MAVAARIGRLGGVLLLGTALGGSISRRALGETAAASASVADERKTGDAEQPEQPAKTAEEPELDVLTFHRSNYIISGFTAKSQVKFQFSIKYDFWPSTSHHTVYFGYTQKSLWDLYDRSSPFRESNYAPELFYAHFHSEIHGQPNPGCGLFSEQVGFEHESNGEGDANSRSWNRVFVDVEASCAGNTLYGLLGLRLWYPLGLSSNESITQTLGYGELVLGLGLDDDEAHMNGLLTLAARKGANFELGKGSLTLDARWRPTYKRLFGKAWRFAPFLWFQLFTGYGETLGSYDHASTHVRLGIGFTDRAR